MPLFYIRRWDMADGKKHLMPLCYGRMGGKAGWFNKHAERPRPIYGLDELSHRPNTPVMMVEGEKAVDAARLLFPHVVCISWPGGTNAVKHVDWSPLEGGGVATWRIADTYSGEQL